MTTYGGCASGAGAGGYRASWNGEPSGGGTSSLDSLSLNLGTAYAVKVGAGAATPDTNTNAGAGGSGVVIIRYPNTFTATFSSGVTQTETTSGSDKINTLLLLRQHLKP